MKLFSKRNSKTIFKRVDSNSDTFASGGLEADHREMFISQELRNRLIQELKFTISSGDYIEKFLTVVAEDNQYFIHPPTLTELTSRELGYDITDIFDSRNLSLLTDSSLYKDSHFFDLIELFIIFNKTEKRKEFTERLSPIFEEEEKKWLISDFMIIDQGETGIRALVPLLKDDKLSEMLSGFYDNFSGLDYKSLAGLSADILQNVLSSNSKTKTKKFSKGLINEVASRWTKKDQVKELIELIDQEALLAKKFNNEISQIRHTDKHTIPVESQSLYKLITYKNMSLVETIIQTLPDEFVTNENSDTLKNMYIKKYKLEDHSGWTKKIPKKEPEEEDIPF